MASNDGENWVTLKTHDDDHALTDKGYAFTWKVRSNGFFYRSFRIQMIGPSSSGNNVLNCDGIELQGQVLKGGVIFEVGTQKTAEKFEV
eukprot:1378554-Amorphochlora_amoeboformis.AAC.1